MADKTIMLACSAGMSTSLLVSKMQNAAKEKARTIRSLLLQHQAFKMKLTRNTQMY